MGGLYQPGHCDQLRGPIRRRRAIASGLAALASALILSACIGPQAAAGAVSVLVAADGEEIRASVPSGSTVVQAIDAAGVTLGELDRLQPPAYTLVTDGTRIEVTRLEESFEVEQVTLPFPQQTLRNEALPEGETRLLQAGENGLQEITYRIVTEEGAEVSRTPVKSQTVVEPKPEILMVGALTAYSPVPIEGTLAYISSGNLWTIAGDSGSRTPLTVAGDADGRILELSPDGAWLAYTRHDPEDAEEINSLWAVSALGRNPEPFALGVSNVVHFADWSPDPLALALAYSTVEPRPAAPGWQANNDLNVVTIRTDGESGRAGPRRTILAANSGGQYGWWGSSFAWASDAQQLAYARPDGVGVVTLDEPALTPVLEMTPYQNSRGLGVGSRCELGLGRPDVVHRSARGSGGPGNGRSLACLRLGGAAAHERRRPALEWAQRHVRRTGCVAAAAPAQRRSRSSDRLPASSDPVRERVESLPPGSHRPRREQLASPLPGRGRGGSGTASGGLVAGRGTPGVDLSGRPVDRRRRHGPGASTDERRPGQRHRLERLMIAIDERFSRRRPACASW